METFIRGAIALGAVVVALFFLRFWRETRDRLFGFFALAFFALAVNRLAIAIVGLTSEVPAYLYVIRLLAYLLILYAMVEKNVRRE